ncbi:MAG: aromatic ring-hydroxylating dioxygenase subunit alpha [Actinobacteria bacterium]|jgi:phenylpropionate dioxygenase-like ring-hydroxylating dioxygenase large terminal subunit|nr:aromatic ring-hydroxylating dioxygenase subunit alpha [Actinomycetota bacterium]MBT3687368.1 aromatic ring-hydroxylating dioxygenase subunit alpha [Actinomycetota bacterium]MBT4036496.1 aromatic ring-hydroxylating dioxygenase subunit alpha [Actinomycetota bacterium]MBT4278775.1 aromatic ring-hydroxylating dioxygenase subunit alpha [Actinomycetota bacterium]MBT4344072.1 aromatic ring-hydroxylating dioxygenase subunit alpha [Actinomycetota bacterium]
MTKPDLMSSTALRSHWHVVAGSDDVSPGPCAVRLLGDDYVLWRDPGGSLVAAPDRCPHREAPLSEGKVTDGCLTCPYHGWVFGEEGRCREVPSAGEGIPAPPRAHLNAIEVVEAYGLVWICPGEPVAPIPEMAVDRDPSFRRINTEVKVWHVAATRMVDNFLDISHFPFVHTGTFGGAQPPIVPPIELEDLDGGYHGYRYEVVAKNPEEAQITSGSSEPVVGRVMSTGFCLPLTVRSTVAYDSGLQHILLLVSTPIDEVTSYFTFVVWRNDDFDVPGDEVIEFDKAIGEEDRVMLERLSGEMPLGQTALVSVQADKASVEWRRRLASMLEA